MTEDSGDRHSLKTLQHSNMEANTFVGKPKKSLKDYFQTPNILSDGEKKKNPSKGTQVRLENIVCDDLCSVTPSEKYWEVVAEKRRVALQETLEENEQLWALKESIVKENTQLKTLLEEANSFVEVFKEVINDSNNDTGIEVGDISQNGEDDQE